MPWQQLKFSVPSNYTEELEQLLLDAGAQSVTLLDAKDQAVFQTEPGETPLWDAVVICGLFDLNNDLSNLTRLLKDHLTEQQTHSFTIEKLPDKEWEKAWMAGFHPMQFGKRLWVCPHWKTPPHQEAINIMLDPGLAFGTGTHATTALCLEWLEQADLKGKFLVDYGCGSGILGIAAVLLGTQHVVAVDNDPQALIATQSNRDSNNIVEQHLRCYSPDDLQLEFPTLKADILIANILAGPLQQLAAEFSTLIAPEGALVLSGILPDQADALLTNYDQWFRMEEPTIKDDWVRLCGIRR